VPRINVRYFLPHLTHDLETVDVPGTTVAECLHILVDRYPSMKRWLFREDGQLANFIDIFVNLDSTYPDELSRQVTETDEIFIVMMINAG
jgi:hypothetical protein